MIVDTKKNTQSEQLGSLSSLYTYRRRSYQRHKNDMCVESNDEKISLRLLDHLSSLTSRRHAKPSGKTSIVQFYLYRRRLKKQNTRRHATIYMRLTDRFDS